MITRVSSVGIQAGDLDQAVEFYVEKLGFEKRRDEPMGPDARWIELAPPGAETVVVPFTPGLVFACDDIQATYRELRGRGVEFTEGPAEQPWGRWAQFKGPTGTNMGSSSGGDWGRPGPRPSSANYSRAGEAPAAPSSDRAPVRAR